MLIFPIALVLGILAGFATGGRIGALSKLSLRLPFLLLAALAVQVLLGTSLTSSMRGDLRLALLTATYVAVGVWLAANLPGRPKALAVGLGVTGVGWLLNMAVVVANGGMPVSARALARIGLGTAALAGGGPFGKHVLLTTKSVLGGLGDTIALPALGTVVSVGDLVMVVGLVIAVAAAMRAVPAVATPAAEQVP